MEITKFIITQITAIHPAFEIIPSMMLKFRMSFKSPVPHIIIIVILTLLVYSNTFEASFHLDDRDYITGNPLLKDFGTLLNPPRPANKSFSNTNALDSARTRFMGHLSFLLNIKLLGTSVIGFHAVNIMIHIFNGIIVYLLVLTLFKSPYLSRSSLLPNAPLLALGTALIFSVHPVQTQAVTYLSQRFTSLAALFYLGAFLSYSLFRTGSKKIYYGISIILCVFAMFTKEISFTLPVSLTLFELIFFDKSPGRFKRLIPFYLSMLIIPLSLFGSGKPFFDTVADAMRASKKLSRWEYLYTQFTVIPVYLRLMILPIGQNFDYDYPVYQTFMNTKVIASFIGLIILAGCGIYYYRTAGKNDPSFRLISFGIFWWFITLSVESSIIPLSDMIFEHRMYLPSFGLILTFLTVLYIAFNRFMPASAPKAFSIFAIAVVLGLSASAYGRNSVWKDETTLWEDVVSKSPLKRRPHYNLAMAYKARGLGDKSKNEFEIARSLKLDYMAELDANSEDSMDDFMDDKVIDHYKKILGINADMSEVHYKFGLMNANKNRFDRAVEHYKKAIESKPNYAEAYNNLGSAYRAMNMISNAVTSYEKAISVNQKYAEPHYNLAILYLELNMPEKAEKEFRETLKIDPQFAMARQFLDYAVKMKPSLKKQ